MFAGLADTACRARFRCLIRVPPMRAAVLLVVLCGWASAAAAQAPVAARAPDGIDVLVSEIERAIKTGDPLALRGFGRFDADAGQLKDFSSYLTSPQATDATVKERDRARLVSGRERLLLEIFTSRAG